MTKKEFAFDNLEYKTSNGITWSEYATYLNTHPKNSYNYFYTVDSVRHLINKNKNREEYQIIDSPTLIQRKAWFNGKTWCGSYDVTNDTLEQFKEAFLNQLKDTSFSIKEESNTTPDVTESIMVELNLPDYHFGKIDGRSIHEQGNNFFRAIVKMCNVSKIYNVDKFLIPIGNDIFNTDNIHYTTTAGTPQKNNSHWHEMFHVAWTAIVRSINYLVETAPVEIVIVQGNHDYQSSVHLGEVLKAYFHNNDKVVVHNKVAEPRKYIQFGNTLIGYTHGDKEKPQDLPLIMATEVPALFAESKFREWHIGHLHKHSLQSYRGVKVEVLPSLVGTDEWHKQMGYDSLKEGIVKVYDFHEGPIADFKIRI